MAATTPTFQPIPRIGEDRIFCCSLVPEAALYALIKLDDPPPSPSNPMDPTDKQIFDAHVPIKTSIPIPSNPLIYFLRNFMVWATSYDNGELEGLSRLDANIMCYGMDERVIRACHGLRVSMFKPGQEEPGLPESVKYFLPLFDASAEIEDGEVGRICRFSEVAWQVVDVVEKEAAVVFEEGMTCFCGGGEKVFRCAYVGEILVDTRVLEEKERGHNLIWGCLNSKVVQQVKEMEFGWGWSGKGGAP
jgi:hypothetical protein